MEKRVWTKPLAKVEQFMANEYVAACGDSGVVYKFECTSPEGTVYYYSNSDGSIDGYGTGTATRAGGYEPCGKKHEAEKTASFCDGFVDRNGNGTCDEGENAIIWLEWGYSIFGKYLDNWHATNNLDMDSWETAKS